MVQEFAHKKMQEELMFSPDIESNRQCMTSTNKDQQQLLHWMQANERKSAEDAGSPESAKARRKLRIMRHTKANVDWDPKTCEVKEFTLSPSSVFDDAQLSAFLGRSKERDSSLQTLPKRNLSGWCQLSSEDNGYRERGADEVTQSGAVALPRHP